MKIIGDEENNTLINKDAGDDWRVSEKNF